jgi:hypothetical protein
MRWLQCALGIAYVATVCGSMAAQAQHHSPSFGTDAIQAIEISAWDKEAVGGRTTWAQNPNFYRYVTRGVLNLIAALSAPQGSLLTAVDLEACDLTNPGEVTAPLYRMNVSGPTGLATAQMGDPIIETAARTS